MKGIAHFATGLCLASFVPGVVQDAANGGALIALGGAAAMLPDMLDFRIERFIEKHDAVVEPDATQPSAQVLADAIATNMRQVLEDGRPRTVQLHPARLNAINWVLYSVRFDTLNGNVCARLDGDADESMAYAGPIDYTYDGALHVEELGGPSLKFTRTGNAVGVEFLPWHRARTHSLVLAATTGLLAGLVFGLAAGMVTFLGYAGHVVEDQLGYMGSNLLWPFTRARSSGLKLLHAGDAPANMATIWLALGLLLLNLDRARDLPQIDVGTFLLLGVAFPAGVMLAMQLRLIWQRHAPAFSEQGRDLLMEFEDGASG